MLHLRPAPRVTAAVVLVAGLLSASAGPALAHPFGPPPSALLSARGTELAIDWRSAPDDAAAIGVALGYLDESVLDVYLEAPTQVAPSAADEDALAAAPELRAYLLEHIVVRQDGERCDGEVRQTTDFVHAGARLAYRCPSPIAEVEIEISMLHDVHEAYRTFGIAEDEATHPAQAVFSVATPRHAMDFSGAGEPTPGEVHADAAGADSGPVGGPIAVLAAVLLAGVLGGILLSRRRGA